MLNLIQHSLNTVMLNLFQHLSYRGDAEALISNIDGMKKNIYI